MPCPCSTSIWRSFVTICSAASLFRAICFLLSSSILSYRLVQKKPVRSIPFLEKFEAIGKVGYEYYEDETYASYLWYEARLNYAFNDHVKVGVAYHGNDLGSGTDCTTQAYTDCDDSIFATLTLSGNLSDHSK
ncbi:MAG: hypothetical protein Q8L53_11950 [Aestuariivirga sp.]|nr:hypothetical protein [Aestuariivirga sp.]